MPSHDRTRPTSDRVRESAFNLIADWAGTAGEPADSQLDRFSFLDLFAYEREEDASLVVAAGLPEPWVRSARGVSVKGLLTPYGPLDLSLTAEGKGIRVRLSGLKSVPPGGIVVRAPLSSPVRTATVDGRPAPPSPGGEVVIRSRPAEVVVLP